MAEILEVLLTREPIQWAMLLSLCNILASLIFMAGWIMASSLRIEIGWRR